MNPKSERAQAAERRAHVLEQRRDRLRRVQHDEQRDVVGEIAVLQVGPECIGIPVSGLRELFPCPAIASLPGLPPWFAGIVQLRGELMSVVDLARWLEVETDEAASRLAVVEGPEGPVGLLAHGVLGFREVAANELTRDYVGKRGAGQRVLHGMTNDLVAILDLERLLADEQLRVGGEASVAVDD